MEEYLDVLDKYGNKTGEKKLRSEIHKNGDWHRAVHIWVIRFDGKILIQKRSLSKDSSPGLWDPIHGGHIATGKSSIETAIEELHEELGLEVLEGDLKYQFTYTKDKIDGDQHINRSFLDVYFVIIDFSLSNLKLQKEEVSEVRLITLEELQNMVENREPGFIYHEEILKELSLIEKIFKKRNNSEDSNHSL